MEQPTAGAMPGYLLWISIFQIKAWSKTVMRNPCRFFHAACIMIITSVLLGCAGSNALITPEKPQGAPIQVSQIPVGVTDFSSNGTPSGGMGTLGLFSLNVDPLTQTAEMESLREGESTDVLEEVDLTNFLTIAPCTNCVKIKSVALDPDGNIVVSIGIKHPFPTGDPFKPITGKNRGDLHVFNVEGIVISNAPATTFAATGEKVAGFKLLNADGYSKYLDNSIDDIYPTDATIHPYITHFDDYSAGNFNAANPMGFESVTVPPPSGNLVMPMGSDYNLQDYVFALDGPTDFIFAVGCTYAISAETKSKRFNPEYRCPQHNKKAASEVSFAIISNDLAGGNTSSSAQVEVHVVDISNGVVVGEGLDQMKADSSVGSISIEVPGVTSTPVIIPGSSSTSGTGHSPSDALVYPATITNTAGAAEGMYPGLIKVLDTYSPGQNGTPSLNGKDGIKRVDPGTSPMTGLFDITEFATYQVFNIFVANANEDPVAILSPDPANGCDNASIWFNGSASYDPDGTIVLYEFDFNLPGGNPLNFSADISGIESQVQSPTYLTGTYTAALRVQDDLGATNIDTVTVNIAPIDGFDVTPYNKNYVTDPSFSNIIFTPNAFQPRLWNNLLRPLGMEAMATGSQYIYAIFYATGSGGNGLYFARSGDDGETWGDYQMIHPFATADDYKGAAICAVGSEVYITTLVSDPPKYYFLYNANHGEGIFSERLILDTPPDQPSIGEPSIAVDPQNTNNIYACYAYYQYTYYIISERAYVLTSNTGPSGTFTLSAPLYSYWNGNYYEQVWTTECKVAPDGDVYVIQVSNPYIHTHKSIDHGAAWNKISDQYVNVFLRHADYCFDPDNPETIYLLVNQRYYNTYQYYRTTNGGASWTTMSSNFQVGLDTAYSNAAICTDSAGNVYAVFTDVTPGNADVYGRYSSNDGTTFSAPFQISNHPGNDAEVEIIPTTNGCNVVIGWLEDRDGTPRVVSRKG